MVTFSLMHKHGLKTFLHVLRDLINRIDVSENKEPQYNELIPKLFEMVSLFVIFFPTFSAIETGTMCLSLKQVLTVIS